MRRFIVTLYQRRNEAWTVHALTYNDAETALTVARNISGETSGAVVSYRDLDGISKVIASMGKLPDDAL